MKTILVTGGCGFIGSNFVLHLLGKHDDRTVVNVDALTYAGNPDNLSTVEDHPNYRFEKLDIRDREGVGRLFGRYDFDAVVHFAAESHVDRSISGPSVFVDTNVVGTQNLLEAARRAWEGRFGERVFVHVSTDEVYGALGPEGHFTESTPLAPNSPYSASKAGSDLVARAYHRTFGFPAVITRCSNNYGPFQYPEKLIPLMITNALADTPLPVYGDGLYTRDWLYVVDHCEALSAVLSSGHPGEVYNIGGNNEKRNIEIVKLIIDRLHKPESLIEFITDRPGHDRRYAIDASKIKDELGWSPSVTFEEGIASTIEWYLKNESWWKRLVRA